MNGIKKLVCGVGCAAALRASAKEKAMSATHASQNVSSVHIHCLYSLFWVWESDGRISPPR